MEIKKVRFIAFCAAVALFIVGVVCYAAFPKRQPPGQPLRIMFQVTPASAGNVLFTMTEHVNKYNLKCVDCHHEFDPSKMTKPQSCSSSKCHKINSGDKKVQKLADAMHAQCKGCHQDSGQGPTDCSGCHVKY